MISGVAPILYYYYGLDKEKEVSEEDKKQQAEKYLTTYTLYTLYAEFVHDEKAQIRSLELAQEAYKAYRKIMPDEPIEEINKKAEQIKMDYIRGAIA